MRCIQIRTMFLTTTSLVIACAITPTGALAQGQGGDVEARNPQAITKGTLDIGNLTNFLKGGGDQFYYSLKYNGKPIREKGTPLLFANVNAPTNTNKPTMAEPGGDTMDFALMLDRGDSQIKSGIFNALGIREFQIPALSSLRGALALSGRLDGKQVNISAGLETPPLNLLNKLGFNRSKTLGGGYTNWLIFGLNGEKQDRDASLGGDQDVLLGTYRAFFGRGFEWKSSDKLRQNLADKIAGAIMDTLKAKTYEDGVAVSKAIEQRIAGGTEVATHAETVLVLLVSKVSDEKKDFDLKHKNDPDPKPQFATPTPAIWQDRLKKAAFSYARSGSEHPTWAVWLESSGWYTASGTPDIRRFQNLLSATLTWWVNPTSPDHLRVQLRYENGFERAAPTIRRNLFAVTAGAEF